MFNIDTVMNLVFSSKVTLFFFIQHISENNVMEVVDYAVLNLNSVLLFKGEV